MRATLGFQRHHKVLGLDTLRQWRIHHRRAPTSIGLEQAGRDGRTAVGGEEPQLVDFLRGQRRQITGEENQVAIAPLVDRLTPRLRLVARGDQFDLLCVRIQQRLYHFVCLLEPASLVGELLSLPSQVPLQRRIPPQQTDGDHNERKYRRPSNSRPSTSTPPGTLLAFRCRRDRQAWLVSNR